MLDTVKNGFDNLGLAFNHYGASAAIVADGLVQAAGGLDILANNMQTYYDVVYTGEEKTALASKIAKEKIDAFNDAIGLSGDVAIDTFEELKAYVESQNTATESGQQAAAAAFALAESIDVFTGSADDAAEAAEAAAEAAALAMSLLLNELEQMELGISTLISQLYTSSNDAYTAELARYNTLTSAAESLDDTVNNLLGTVENSSASLGQAQRNYNDLLAQAQSGDASVVGDLQSAAATLVDALDSSYGYNDSNALGVAQIAGQLSSVSDVLNRTAGSEPVDPSLSASDLSAIEREALVSELIENLKDLGLAENKSVLSLMTENGVYAENLANDLGIDLDTLRSTNANLSSDQVNKIVYLADSIGLSFADLGRDLGADFGTLKASISSNLASLPDLSSEISTRLTPFLSAIESSNDYTELNDSLLFLRAYASTLPEDIRSNLDSSLDAIIGTTDELANVVDSSSELLRQQVLTAADILSVDIGSLNSATQQSSLEELKELANLGGLFDLSIASLGSLLGADFDTLGDSIANGLSDLPGLSSEIRSGLAPYLSAIEQSNDSSSLEAILGVTKDYISTLPSDIKDNLSARLDAIVGTGLSTNEAISSLGELNEAQTSILLNSLGSDLVSIAEAFGIDIEELKDSSVNIGDKTLLGIAKLSEETNIGLGSLADNFGIDISRLSQTFAVRIGDSIQQLISLPSYITSGLSPFLESISLASDSTELNDGISNLSGYINSLPAGIKEQLSGQLDELIGANYLIDSSIQGMSLSDTIDIKEQILASGFDIEDLDISSVYGLTGILNDFNVDIYDLIGALNLSVRDISSSVKESIEDTTKNLFEINQGRAWWGGMENEDEFEHEKYAANSELQELVNKVGLATSTTALEVAIENVESFMNAIASSEWITGFDTSRMNQIGYLLKSLENEDLEMPSFDIGSDYIASNQVAKIHKGESIFTASQSANLRENTLRIMRDAATRSGSENAMASAISELKDEVASLRRENKAASFELVKHTKRSSNTLTAWNANGMPTEAES